MIWFKNEYPVYSSLLVFEFFTNNDYRVGNKKLIRETFVSILRLDYHYYSELVGSVSMSNLSVWLGFIALTHSKLR
jgi:hypothetical protein